MRLLLDACILYPTVLREILLGVARSGAYDPLYSAQILDEWRHVAARSGPEADAVAAADIALLRAGFPAGEVTVPPEVLDTLSLPDAGDHHVLGAAIAGKAGAIVTANLKDFPGRTLARHGLMARSPDSVLMELDEEGAEVRRVVAQVQARTEAVSGRAQPLRALLKRAGLPRLGKRLG